MIKKRILKESNYSAIWYNGKTIRIALDPSKPITELAYPEFYDIKVTNKCYGKCPWCYQNSEPDESDTENIVQKVRDFFSPMSLNDRPFQVAAGGGEPTEHEDFIELLQVLKEELDICPNYTTNGMWIDKDAIDQYKLISATKKYCGGVAVSCHPHLEKYWTNAANIYWQNEIKLNFHIIISDKESIDRFIKIYDEWKDKVDYFVLLPYSVMGRAKEEKKIDWEYLITKLPDSSKLAFGANFYPYLQRGGTKLKISLYEPEICSKYLDLKDMKIYKSSFSTNE